MKIHFSGGHIRQALNTFEDAEFLALCMADWPQGGWNLNRAMAHVGKPRIDVDKDFHAVLIYCDPWPAGVCGVRFFKGPPSGFQVNFLAMHPDERGKGKFTLFSDALAWFANQYLECDAGRFDARAPQVQHRADVLRGTIDGTMVYMVKDETAKAVKTGFTVTL